MTKIYPALTPDEAAELRRFARLVASGHFSAFPTSPQRAAMAAFLRAWADEHDPDHDVDNQGQAYPCQRKV